MPAPRSRVRPQPGDLLTTNISSSRHPHPCCGRRRLRISHQPIARLLPWVSISAQGPIRWLLLVGQVARNEFLLAPLSALPWGGFPNGFVGFLQVSLHRCHSLPFHILPTLHPAM